MGPTHRHPKKRNFRRPQLPSQLRTQSWKVHKSQVPQRHHPPLSQRPLPKPIRRLRPYGDGLRGLPILQKRRMGLRPNRHSNPLLFSEEAISVLLFGAVEFLLAESPRESLCKTQWKIQQYKSAWFEGDHRRPLQWLRLNGRPWVR